VGGSGRFGGLAFCTRGAGCGVWGGRLLGLAGWGVTLVFLGGGVGGGGCGGGPSFLFFMQGGSFPPFFGSHTYAQEALSFFPLPWAPAVFSFPKTETAVKFFVAASALLFLRNLSFSFFTQVPFSLAPGEMQAQLGAKDLLSSVVLRSVSFFQLLERPLPRDVLSGVIKLLL